MPKIIVHNTETGETQEFKAGYGANLRQAANYKIGEDASIFSISASRYSRS